MKCKKCGEEILKGDKFCAKCGNKIESVVTNEKDNTTASKETIKIKFNYALIGIILVFLIVVIAIIVFNRESIKYLIIGTPEWIKKSGDEEVFNIYREETENKIKSELEKKIDGSTINLKDISSDGQPWLEVYNTSYDGYVGNTIHFRTEYRANLVSIEGDNNGKVKSITYLYATDSIENTVVNEVISQFLNDIGFTYEQQNDKEFVNKYLNISKYEQEKAVINTGKFSRTFSSEAEVNRIVSAYRRSGFNLPYTYDYTENGKYITIECK